MGRGKTEKLGNILRNVLSRRAIAGGYHIRQVRGALEKILTEEENRHVRAGSIKNGCLTILVASSSLIYELSAFKSHEILERLHAAGHDEIRKIRFELEKSEDD